jgi:hypothetical protein
MAVGEPLMSDANELLALYEAKASAELGDADALAGVGPGSRRGEVIASVAVVVGESGGSAGAPLAGEAGEAAAKGLVALGFEAASEFVIASRPTAMADDEALLRRLHLAIEAVDPTLVLALDAVGAKDLSAAYGLADLVVGKPVVAHGRTFGYVGEFAGSLGDDRAKARAWAAMKAIARADASRTSTRRHKGAS